MRALVNTPNATSRVTFRDLPEPEPHDDEVVVSVHSSSINRGELALLRRRPEGWRPGQDVAGLVQRQARNGKGPKAGERVAALIEGAGWAERVAIPIERLAHVPDEVELETAAAMPMVGLTALGLLRRCGPVIGREIVVTGASGGVGTALVQLGKLAGAEVTAVARAEHAPWLSEFGATKIIPTMADANGRFDIVLESVGGSSLEEAIAHVRPDGRIICFGNSSGAKAAFDMFSFFGAENARVETFFSYRALVKDQIGTDLAVLLQFLSKGRLKMPTTVINWENPESGLSLLEGRGTRGKIVLAMA